MYAFSSAYFLLIAAVLGLILGSFYNVCIHRTLTEENIVKPGSKCPKCGHKLSWWENIPLVSYIILTGKCRACNNHISLRYPAVEAISGLWALSIAYKFGPSWAWLVFMIFGGIFIVLSFIDLDSFILPDIITLPSAPLAFLCAVFLLDISWQESLIGALAGGGSFWVMQKAYFLLKKIEGLGTGDIKLMVSIGALLGWKALPLAIFLAALSGLAASLYFLTKDGAKGLQTKIPFGPFLCLGAMLTILFGPELMRFIFG